MSLTNLKIVDTRFPALDAENAAKMGELVETFLPPSVTISMYRLIASAPKTLPLSAAPLKNDPPQIFVSYRPAILLEVNGQPIRAPIENTKLEYVVNTHWRRSTQPRESYRPTNNAAAQNTTGQSRAEIYQQQRPTAANGQATTQPRSQNHQQRPQTFNQQAGSDPLSGVQRKP